MHALRRPIRASVLLLALAAAAHPQAATQPAQDPAIPPTRRHKPAAAKAAAPPYNFNLVVLDPAHGGSDAGARFADDVVEKEITLAFAERLKPMLAAQGFTVTLSRNTDVVTRPVSSDTANPAPPAPAELSADQRVEIANRSHAVACILLHAANGGHGVHLYTSSLTPPSALDAANPRAIVPWDTAQQPALPQSLRLASDLATAFNASRIPLVSAHASIRPIDSMACPAVALEIAPLTAASSGQPMDIGYQTRVAEAVTAALVLWRGHAQLAAQAAAAAAAATSQPAVKPGTPAERPSDAPKPRPRPKPRPVTPPIETPTDTGGTPARVPAPVIRQTPAQPPATVPPSSQP